MSKIRLVSGLIVLGFVLNVLVHVFTADVHYKKARRLLKEGKYAQAVEFATSAIEKNPREPRYRYGRAQVLLVLLAATSPDDLEDSAYLRKRAEIDLARAIELNPTNLVTLRNTVPLYYYLSLDANEYYTNLVQDHFLDLGTSFPNDVGVQVLLAKYEKMLGFTAGYAAHVDAVRTLRPDLLDWYLVE